MAKESIFQLRKLVNFVKEDERTLFVEFLGSSFLIQEEQENISLVEDLLDFLSHPRSQSEILGQYKNRVGKPEEITETLDQLISMGVVERLADSPSGLSDDEKAHFNRELQFFNFFTPFLEKNNYQYFSLLRGAKVLLLNAGILGLNLLKGLIECGVENITVLDSGILSLEGEDFDPFFYSSAEVGKKRIDLLKLKLHTPFSSLEFDELRKDESRLIKHIEKADLVISACDHYNPAFNRLMNKYAFNLGKRILFIEADHGGGKMGPAVIPGEGACYECAYQRERANMDVEYLEHFDFAAARNREKKPVKTFKPFYRLLASYGVSEAMKILTNYIYPETFRGIYYFDFLNNRIEHHPVLKNPFCPVCGYIDSIPPVMEFSKEVFFEE